MRRFLMVLVAVLAIVSLSAKMTTYAQMRSGWWYGMEDEAYNGTASRTVNQAILYTNSRFGSCIASGDFTGKFELGVNSSLYLRHLYGTYQFDGFSLTVGKTFTGLADFGNQAAAVVATSDRCIIGYGMAFDGMQNQVRLDAANAYVILMQAPKMDPWGDANGIDTIIPKINAGYKYTAGNTYLHPSVGFCTTSYNEDFSLYDDTVTAYILSVTGKHTLDALCLQYQVHYGQNLHAYGISGSQIPDVTNDGTDVVDITTMGGYLDCGYKLNDTWNLCAGVGYESSESDLMDDADAAMTAFLQAKYCISKDAFIIPEVGMFDNMEDGFGNDEGAVTYFGAKIQYNFSYVVD
jgi:hypothetical protein